MRRWPLARRFSLERIGLRPSEGERGRVTGRGDEREEVRDERETERDRERGSEGRQAKRREREGRNRRRLFYNR